MNEDKHLNLELWSKPDRNYSKSGKKRWGLIKLNPF